MPSTHPIYAAAGAALLIFIFVDVILTTIHVGGGPITRLLVGRLWRLARATHHRSRGSHRAMGIAGLACVLLTVWLWVLGLWMGWWLVFMGDPHAVLDAQLRTPVGSVERLYFTGFTVFTLGNGELIPSGRFWQITTAIASFSGFFLVTFVVTYLMPVVQAASQHRALANRITAIGANPTEILASSFEEGAFDTLWRQLDSVLDQVSTIAQQHRAYPVLHFFHPRDARSSAAVALARLNEALWIVELGLVDERTAPPISLVRQYRRLLDQFVISLGIERHDDETSPPLPAFTLLTREGIELDETSAIREAFDDERVVRQRCLMHALVHAHGWPWDAVVGEEDASREEAEERDERAAADGEERRADAA